MKIYLIIACLFCFDISTYALKITDRAQISGNESDITEIDLSNKGLSAFPVEILACKNLVSLNLSENGIITIPLQLGELRELKEINFSGNQGLSYVDLDDLLEKATFQLTDLNLANCDMGYIPHQIGRQKGLKRLNVSGNKLNNLPYPVIQLTKLENVDVSNNQIDDLSWQVNQWWHLKSLDVSDNPNLKTPELIFALSVAEGLDKLVVSHVSEFPKEFQQLEVRDLEIRNSHIRNFPRVETSKPIQRLSFINCTFGKSEKFVETINDYVRPRFIKFNQVGEASLASFLKLKVDSVDLKNNRLTDIRAIAAVQQLKWVDARGNRIDEESIQTLKTNRPDIELILSEPVAENRGVDPPIPSLAPKPIFKTVQANQDNEVQLGRSSFKIPQDAFLDANGNVYNGEVVLEYTEYFTPEAIFLSGITMTADSSGENMVFSSGGMFNIEAKDAAGNELEMNPVAPVNVSLLSSSPNPDMNLYVLSDNGVWEYKGKDKISEPFKMDMNRVDSVANSTFYNFDRKNIIITENRVLPIVKSASDEKSFSIKFLRLSTDSHKKSVDFEGGNINIKRPDYAVSKIVKTTFIYDGDRDSLTYYRKWFKKVRRKSQRSYNELRVTGASNNYNWGINYITNLQVKLDEATDRMHLTFFYKDSLVSVPVVVQSEPENPTGRIKAFQRFFKGYSREKRRDEMMKRKRSRQTLAIIKKEEFYIKQMARDLEMKRQLMRYENAEFLNSMANVSSVERSFQLTGFGIWNCDQLRRMIRPAAIRDFTAENDEPILEPITRISVIDYEKNGVFSYYSSQGANFDAASGKTAIVVFFSGGLIGIYKSWKAKKELGEEGGDSYSIKLNRFDISNMNVGTLIDLINN